MVARRTNEIGIRMVLGADRARVVGLIMREAAGMLLVGLIVSAVLAQLTAKTAESLLYGLSRRDPITLLAAAGLLATVALGRQPSACPACGATRSAASLERRIRVSWFQITRVEKHVPCKIGIN